MTSNRRSSSGSIESGRGRRKSTVNKPWEYDPNEEKFEMGDREFKILQAPASAEWGGIILKLFLLPTTESWHIFITYTVIIDCMLTMLCTVCLPEKLLYFIPIYVTCDCLYLFDLILNLLHRFWKRLRLKYQIKPKSSKCLMVDGLSLLVQEGICIAIFGFSHWTTKYCRTLTFVRLYRAVKLCGEILGSVRSKRWAWFLFLYATIFFFILHIASCFWYHLGADNFHGWPKLVAIYYLEPDSVYERYLTSFYATLSFLSNTGFGDFRPTDIYEGFCCVQIMVLGLILMTILVAVLMVQLINLNRRKFGFARKLGITKQVLEQIEASPELSEQILAYYSVLWTKKNGVIDAPELYTLPAPMRMELMYDINIAHLQNSLLFRHQPEPLLRQISLLIKHVFLLPGDVVFHQGVVKGKMIFLSGGVLEVLSDEDDQSPIISFKAGTVLGEVALLMTVPAKATVRAATYAELQVIERKDFMRMMVDHPDAIDVLRMIIQNRLENVDERLVKRDKDDVIMNLLVSNAKEFRPIKLLKDNLSIAKEDVDEVIEFKGVEGYSSEDLDEISTSGDKSNFNTECLPLYKLIENVTMIENPKVCISANFPWILHPHSSLAKHWNNLVNISQIVLCLVLPYYVVYTRKLPPFMNFYCYFSDVIYMLDIMVCCTTAVILRNKTLRTFKNILYYRLQFFTFYVDVLSLFPIETFTFGFDMKEDRRERIFLILKLNRLLRIWRLRRIATYFENNLSFNVMVRKNIIMASNRRSSGGSIESGRGRRKSTVNKPWEYDPNEEKFEMGDREFKILQAPASTEWGGIMLKLFLLPSTESWHIFITYTVIIDCMLTMLCTVCLPEKLLYFIPIYVTCDCLYLFDLILNLLHRFWKRLRVKYQIKPKSTKCLMVDGLSLLVQEGICIAMFGFSHWTTKYCRTLTFVRLYRAVKLCGEILGSVRSKRWAWFLFLYATMFFFILHIASCFWYHLGADNFHGWPKLVAIYYLEPDTVYERYLTSFYATLSFLSNTGFGDFRPTDIYEGFCCVQIMVLGLILMTILVAVLMVQLINLNRRKFGFARKLGITKQVLEQIEASPELSEQILAYYSVLWTKKNGVIDAPELYTLPAPMRMELMYDINIAHLQNSLLFRHQPEPLLRQISLLIKHVFLLPGDVVFHQGVVKGKMIFLSGGVLEVLSDEDDQSPIISFKAGTVLGEVALLMTVPAKATVRAATYAELQVIERKDFMRMMVDHPDAVDVLRMIIQNRLENVDERLVKKGKDDVIMNLLVSNAKEFRPIKLLKDNLSIAKEDVDEVIEFKGVEGYSSEDLDEISTSGDKSNFNTECLPLYKLIENVTMIENPKVCISANFPWILHPHSSLVKHWNNLVNISQIVLCLVLPYYVVYTRKLPPFMNFYCYFSDVIYMLDIMVCCTTAVILRNKTLRTFKNILYYRLQFFTFYVDVLSLFPIETFTFGFDMKEDRRERIFLILKLNRLLRIWRLRRISAYFENNLSFNVMIIMLTKFTILFGTIAFWAGALLYVESCFYPVCAKYHWFYAEMMEAVGSGTRQACYENPVAMSTYFGTSTLFLLGLGDIFPNNFVDIYFVCILIFIGIFLISYSTAQLSATFSLYDTYRRDFKDNVDAFGRFLEQNNLMRSLHQRVIVFFRLQWNYDQGTGRDFFLSSVPPSIRSALQSTELKTALSQTQLFQMVDEDFLIMIAEGAKVQIIPPDEVIAYTGDMSREMYIILSGHFQILNDSGDVLNTYGPGAQFGVIEMIYGIPKRYTTKTVTNCRVIIVDYRTYIQAMSMFPTLMEETKQVVDEEDLVQWVHQIDNERLNAKVVKKDKTKKTTRLSRLFSYCDCLSRFFGSSFICTIAQCRSSKGKESYWKPFADMGKLQFVGCFLMPLAIHPGGTFIRIWIFIRFLFIMSVCLVGPYYIALIPYSYQLFPILIATAYCTYLDMYLLFHVGYYNEKGLLITHPKYTALHYLSHSFIIDMLAIFPFSAIAVTENSKHTEGHDYGTHLMSPHIHHCTWHINLVLQFHRVQELFYYLEGDVLKDMSHIRFFKFVPSTLVIINLLTSLIFAMTCKYTFLESERNDKNFDIVVTDPKTSITYYGYLNCTAGNWLYQSPFRNISDPTQIYLVAIYWITDTLVGIGTGVVTTGNTFNMYLIIFTTLFGRLLFAYVLAHLAYGRAQFSKIMSKYQEDMKDMMNHLKHESVDYTWREKMYEYFEYLWYRTNGIRPQELCLKLNTALMEDTVVFLYEKTLREVPLFENVEKSFIRVIAKHLTQEYFLKGDTIIRCFDVQKDIYIIYRGKVEILSSWNEMVGCMSVGGLFGNIRQINAGFRSVSIIASRNLDVLVIPSETFYNVIKDYPKIKRNMDTLLETVTDYIMPTTIIDDDAVENSLEESDITEATNSDETMGSSLNESLSQGTPRRSVGSFSANWGALRSKRKQKLKSLKTALNICLPYKWFRFSIFPDNDILKIVDVGVLLVSYYDVMVILYCFVTQTNHRIWLYCSFALESIFYFKIFLHFHVAVMDRHGNYVTKCRKIVHHYFKNYSKLFWDVVPNFPVEFFYFLFHPEERIFALSALRLIHLLRLKYMLDYFEQGRKELMSNLAWNQLLKIVLFMTTTVHIFSSVWLLVGCPFGECLTASNYTWTFNFDFKNRSQFNNYANAVYYVISLASTTGIGDIYPLTYIAVLFSISIILLARLLVALIIGDIVTILNVSSRSLVKYEYKIHNLQDFLRNQNLSDHQMEKLCRYMKTLWIDEKGRHMPTMINSCPYVLKCDIMSVMYGQHLRNSFVFQGINEALIRQLAVRLVRMVVFQGNYIVQHGDIDQNMYFIHSGEVSVVTIHPNLTETQHELLQSYDMFGLAQGLYHGLPHHFSFRAVAKASILVLNLDTWYYMLRYFPKEQELIYKRSQIVYSKF